MSTSNNNWTASIPEEPCSEGLAFASTQANPSEAWKNCTRADWMLWAIQATDNIPYDAPLLRVAVEIAQTVAHLLPDDDVNHDARIAFLRLVKQSLNSDVPVGQLCAAAEAVAFPRMHWTLPKYQAAVVVAQLAEWIASGFDSGRYIGLDTCEEWSTLFDMATTAAEAVDGTAQALQQASIIRNHLSQPLLPRLQD